MKYYNHIQRFTFLIMLAVSGGWLMSCNEEVDMSDRYTFTDETVLSYLQKDLERDDNKRVGIPYDSRFNEYVKLLGEVPISDYSSATVAQLLSARGHYTVFAPDNKAIADYLQDLKDKGVITEASWDGFNDLPNGAAVLDSIRKVIVYNSIIDCNEEEAYNLGTFPKISSTNPKKSEDFERPNLNDRKLYWTYDLSTDDYDSRYQYINGKALIDLSLRDLEAINGRIHGIHGIIAPSNETMRDLFDKWVTERSGQFTIFARLLRDCGLFDTLSKTQDEAWEVVFKTNQVTDLGKHPSFGEYGHVPEHRKYGFTIFAEPDDLWLTELASVGITKDKDDVTTDDVKQYLLAKNVYTDATTGTDYSNENNIVNRFVTYHVLPEAISSGKLVIHYNEMGHDYTIQTSRSIPVYDYYTTMGRRRLLKIYQPGKETAEDGIYLNRFPVLRNWRGAYSYENANINDYQESGDFKAVSGSGMNYQALDGMHENRGVKIITSEETSSEEGPLNGYIYALDRMLVYTENVQNQLHNERIRIDCATMFPEMINNDWRRPMGYYQVPRRCTHGCKNCVAFPAQPEYPYFKDLWIEKGSQFYYLPGYACGWSNYQMDEYNVVGNYEFTMKLPPVPKDDIYELRFGVSAGSNNRSMCQVYFGEDRSYLPAADIPMDLRVGFVNTRFYGGASQVSPFGYSTANEYKADANKTQEEQDEIDKLLRSRGFMKGPQYFFYGNNPSEDMLARRQEHVTRRVMVRQRMSPNKTYYIKFKNVLQNEKLEFYMDYLEFVSKEVYDNPNEPEDIW